MDATLKKANSTYKHPVEGKYNGPFQVVFKECQNLELKQQ